MSEQDADFGPPETDADFGAPEPGPQAPDTARRIGTLLSQPVQMPPSNLNGQQASDALKLAKRTGYAPAFVAQNLAPIQQQADQTGFEDELGAAPITAEYAAQSPIHAALVKDDVGPLEALEQGLLDVGHAVAATKEMTFPSAETEQNLLSAEGETSRYEKRPNNIITRGIRDIPMLATFYLSGAAGKLIGKQGGELGAQAGAMFLLNRGTLYRQIMQQMPYPETDEQGTIGVGPYDQVAYEQKARLYATVGAGASAVLSTGISHAIGMALPGIVTRANVVSNGIIARAFTDPATREIVANLIGKTVETEGGKVVTGAAGWGGHTLAGALAMAIPAVADDATVQKALKGTIDPGKAAAAGWEAFKNALLPAATLSALPHALPVVRNVGRAALAPFDAARLDHNVEQIQAAKLTTRHPEEAEKLVGRMTDKSDADTVFVSPEAMADPKLAAKVADAAGPHAMGDAQVTGGDVAVPAEKYLVRLGGDHAALRENVKTLEDGATPKEAAEIPGLNAAPSAQEPAAAPPPSYELPPTPKVTVDDEAVAREHIEGKTIGEIRPSYYETQARRAGERALKLAAGPDAENERILTKYAEAMDVSLDTLRNAVQGTFSADTLPQARKKLRTAESEANRLEAGRLDTLKGLEEQHAANVAMRQGQIQAAVAQQKNGKLFADVAHDIRNEMDRTEAKLLKKAGDGDFLATLQRAGPEYRDAHDAIFSAVFAGPEAPPQHGALDPLLDKLQRDGLPLGFDPDHIRALLADPLQWKDLTPAEARNVADAVDNIRTAAKTANEIALGDRRQGLRDFVDGVKAHLDISGVPDKGLPAPSRAGVGRGERISEGAGALNAELLRPEVILERLGPDGRKLFDTFVKARNAKEELARQTGDFFTKAYEQGLPKAMRKSRTNGVTGPGSPVVADDKWVRQDLWTLAGWYGSESGADRLRLGLRISDDQIQTALSQLTKPEAEWIDALHALHDEKLFPLIRDHEVANTGASPPKIDGRPYTVQLADGEMHTFRGGYWPAKYRGKAGPETTGEPASIEDYWGALKNGFPATSKSFTKERVKRFEGMPDLNWSSYAGHINSVLHYLSYDDFVRNTGKVFQDAEFRTTVERRLGDQEMRELDKFLTVSARGKVEAPTEGAAKWSSMVGGGFRSAVATGAFQLNLPVVFGQLSHLPAAMWGLRIGPGDILQGLGKAFVPDSWTADHAESQQLGYRWNGYSSHMREMLSSIGPGDKPLGRKWLDAVGWSMYHSMDGFLSKTIYGAAKAKAESDWFSGKGLSGQDAIDYADRAVSLMMPPLNIAEQSSIVRDRGLIGSLLLVRNFPNTLYNVGAVNAWQAKTSVWAADPGWQRTVARLGGTTAAAASYLGMVWSAHIFGRFLMGHGRQEDETTPQWLEREALAAPFYPVPILGDVAAPLAEAAVSPTKTLSQTIRHGLHAAPVIALLEGSIREFGKAVGDNGTNTDRAFAAAKLAATALRLPVYPLRPARYSLDLFSGDASPRGPWDVAGGLFYGQRDRQSRNPATTIQDVASGEFQ